MPDSPAPHLPAPSPEPPAQRRPLARLLSLWFGFRAPVGRGAYASSGFGLAAFKFALDYHLAWRFDAAPWNLASYLSPSYSFRDGALGYPPDLFHWLLIVQTFPFIWIGVSMTVRRAMDAGLHPASGLMFFVPYVNYLFLMLLCLLPGFARGSDSAWKAELHAARAERWASAWFASLVGMAVGAGMTFIIVTLLGQYSGGLFVGTPFVIGFLTASVYNARGRRSALATQAVVQLALLLSAGVLLLFAVEGVICLLMAYPLAGILAALGASVAWSIGPCVQALKGPIAGLILALPILTGAEMLQSPPPERAVTTAVIVDAPPDTVWPYVVGPLEMTPPRRWIFRLGIAAPERVEIFGSGVGAVRHCIFSTGPFIEPVTHWEPGRHLAFDVAESPPTMREWSPYPSLRPPHLTGGLDFTRGEFRLTPLPGGRTRIVGVTRYRMNLAPAPYWSLFADALIHRIHERVFEQIAIQAERGSRSQLDPAN